MTRYKHLAPTVLVLTAILTVSPDLQQHAASDFQRVILLFFIKLKPQDAAGGETCARSLRHQFHQLFRRHAGFFGHLYGHSVASSIDRNDAELFGRLPQPRISK